MPAALLARFGRATAEQVVQHVEERMAAPRERGFRARFAGREVRPGMERDLALGFLSQLARPMGAGMGAAPMGAASMGVPVGAAPMAMGGHTAGPGAGAPGGGMTGMAAATGAPAAMGAPGAMGMPAAMGAPGAMGVPAAMGAPGAMGMPAAMGMQGRNAPPGGATAMAGRGSSAGMQVGGLLGDAETGTGMDIGGGLVFADTVTGLSLDVRMRTLVVHQAAGFRERVRAGVQGRRVVGRRGQRPARPARRGTRPESSTSPLFAHLKSQNVTILT